jgi:hypothetical protein
MNMDKEIFIIVAYKNGDRGSHSYTLGCTDDLDLAKEIADEHSDYRGGKYAVVVETCILNDFKNLKDIHCNIKEIYRNKSTAERSFMKIRDYE